MYAMVGFVEPCLRLHYGSVALDQQYDSLEESYNLFRCGDPFGILGYMEQQECYGFNLALNQKRIYIV